MAASAVAAADGKTLCSTPFLIKRWEGVTTEADTAVFTHGEDRSPDLVFAFLDGTMPAGSSMLTVVSRETSATTFTIDCEDDGNDTFTCVAIWLSQASGGIS